MTGVVEHAMKIEDAARYCAHESGAIKVCHAHDYIDIHQGDDEAERLAYKIGTNLWKEGGLGYTRNDLMDAIKSYIDASAYECPQCAAIRDE